MVRIDRALAGAAPALVAAALATAPPAHADDSAAACRKAPTTACLQAWAERLSAKVSKPVVRFHVLTGIGSYWLGKGDHGRALAYVRKVAALDDKGSIWRDAQALSLFRGILEFHAAAGRHEAIRALLPFHTMLARRLERKSDIYLGRKLLAFALIRSGRLDEGLALVRDAKEKGTYDLGWTRVEYVTHAARLNRLDDAKRELARIKHKEHRRQAINRSLAVLWAGAGPEAAVEFARTTVKKDMYREAVFRRATGGVHKSPVTRARWDAVTAAEAKYALALPNLNDRFYVIVQVIGALQGREKHADISALYGAIRKDEKFWAHLKQFAKKKKLQSPDQLLDVTPSLVAHDLKRGRVDSALARLFAAPERLGGRSQSISYFIGWLADSGSPRTAEVSRRLLEKFGKTLREGKLGYDPNVDRTEYLALVAHTGDTNEALRALATLMVLTRSTYRKRAMAERLVVIFGNQGKLDAARTAVSYFSGDENYGMTLMLLGHLTAKKNEAAKNKLLDQIFARRRFHQNYYQPAAVGRALLRNGGAMEDAFKVFDALRDDNERAYYLVNIAPLVPESKPGK